VGSIANYCGKSELLMKNKNYSMKYKIINSIAIVAVITTFFTACIKDEVKRVGDGGKTFLKFLEAPENVLYFSPFSNIDTIDLFSARKDANSNASLNAVTTAKLTSMPQLIDSFNNDNGTDFELLPDSMYTLLNSSFTKTATGYNVTFADGKFANDFHIALNGAKWNVVHTYALAFSLSTTDNVALNGDQDTIMVFLSVKNKYDGKYTVTGSMIDAANGGLTGDYPWSVEFHTSGPNTVQVYDVGIGGVYHGILSGASKSYYGAFGIEFTFDPLTNAVVKVSNVYAPAANTRDALLDNSKPYTWVASNKTLDIKYYMLQPSVVTVAPYIRTTFTETFKYTGPR
jgi:hypothetical protein